MVGQHQIAWPPHLVVTTAYNHLCRIIPDRRCSDYVAPMNGQIHFALRFLLGASMRLLATLTICWQPLAVRRGTRESEASSRMQNGASKSVQLGLRLRRVAIVPPGGGVKCHKNEPGSRGLDRRIKLTTLAGRASWLETSVRYNAVGAVSLARKSPGFLGKRRNVVGQLPRIATGATFGTDRAISHGAQGYHLIVA